MDLGEISRANSYTAPGELTEDNLIEMQASELVPDEKEEYIEEAVPAKKRIRQAGRRVLWNQDCLSLFNNMDSSMIQALRLKQGKKDWHHIEKWKAKFKFSISREMKSKIEITTYFCKVTPRVPVSPSTSTASASAIPKTAGHILLLLLVCLSSMKTVRMSTFRMTHCH